MTETALLPLGQACALIAGCYMLSFFIMHALANVSGRYHWLRLWTFPGVVVHELSHAAACVLTFTPIEQISFWTETGGVVMHHKPRWSLVFQPVISLAPFVVGIACLGYLSHWIFTAVWMIKVIVLILMLSIAATLAPSKTDMIQSLEGIAAVGVIVALLIWQKPAVLPWLNPWLLRFIHSMLPITGLLLVFWIILLLLANLRSYTR